MSRQQRFVYLPLIATSLLCLFVGMWLAAWKRFSKPERSGKVVKHSVGTPSDEVLKYWTVDKMRNAKAARMPVVDDLRRVKQQPGNPSDAPRSSHEG